MLEQIRGDIVASFLLRNSSLSEAQLDTMLASTVSGNLEYRTKLRERGKVSKGAFMRTLRQGQKNIESSLYTLLLVSYLKLIVPEGLARISRTSRMLMELREAAASKEDLLTVVEAIQEFVQNFAERKLIV